jgi:predicted GH43/DUF377 family glycosyl hydrolase
MWPYTVNAVFNPAAAIGPAGETVLLTRVEDRSGISHLTAARSDDGFTNWAVDPKPTMNPEDPDECWGIEDPRITTLDDSHVVAYTGLSQQGPLVRLARSRDLVSYDRIGTVCPPEDKDAVLFSEQIGGRFAMLHRPVSVWAGGGAHIWISFSPDLVHWGDPKVVLRSREAGYWDREKVGAGPPPLKTSDGWLLMFHGVKSTAAGLVYRVGLALLDLEDPTIVLARTDEWVFGPEAAYERAGDVPNVVFPTGWVAPGDGTVRMYYGAADTTVCVANADIDSLVAFTLSHDVS